MALQCAMLCGINYQADNDQHTSVQWNGCGSYAVRLYYWKVLMGEAGNPLGAGKEEEVQTCHNAGTASNNHSVCELMLPPSHHTGVIHPQCKVFCKDQNYSIVDKRTKFCLYLLIHDMTNKYTPQILNRYVHKRRECSLPLPREDSLPAHRHNKQ